MSDVTQVLEAIQDGDPRTTGQLLPLVYQELRRIAAVRMANESSGHTLQATELVHETYLRLLRLDQQTWENRGHFLAAAAEAMRRILVEIARRKHAQRRGRGQRPLNIADIQVPSGDPAEKVLLVDEALKALACQNPLEAEVVKLRYFVGLKNEEIAQVLHISEKTVRRHWAFAKVWLYQEIGGQIHGDGHPAR